MNVLGRPGDSMNLLQELVEHSIDDDYYVAAERREDEPPQKPGAQRVASVAALAVFALLITLAAIQTYDRRPQAEVEREALVDQIHERESSVAELQDSVDGARDDVEALQAGASDPEHDERVVNEQISVGMVAVTGPGATVLVDNADDYESQPQGRIRDTDMQLLVNGLWNAGAEAVAVNGQRITTLTSIRTAGEAITVNYRSLSAPYTVEAIGNMDTLAARFLDTQAGSVWSSLANNYGMQFEVSSEPDLSLPAAPKGRLTVRHAQVKGDNQ
ncbi:DUF881 domain-containing protein [Solicola gregarius]|uniref:DUF881 domain-containing protein n=1 Tax=Solicola gregarius TaxID=2908642 RepID=A0AA46THX7_9ACTN|nr:DUF881 domain-containing protein [Solicola gregarius]UYM05147.1 DUF881 domain-containing protein [Solicola gregarius]